MKKILRVTLAVVFAVLLMASANPQPASAMAPTSYYVVRPGDTLSSIAWRYGVSSWSIARANGLWNPNYIFVGQTLIIPGTHPNPPGPMPGPIYRCSYRVNYGDTLYSIAARLGVDVWTLANLNGIRNPNWLYAGQWLRVPGCYS